MPCLPDKTLTAETAPHLVKVYRDIPWREGQRLILWLADNPETVGRVHAGRHRGMVINAATKTREPEQYCWFRFTDANTAFLFKLYHAGAR